MADETKPDTSNMFKKLDAVRDAILSLSDVGIRPTYVNFASFDARPTVNISGEAFLKLFKGKTVKRSEYRGDWHYHEEWRGVLIRACHSQGAPPPEETVTL